jgi:hypothetical protein
MTAEGGDEAVGLMVKLGWPIAVRGGDCAQSCGFPQQSRLARFLLAHGASWQEEHGHGDNAQVAL